MSVLYGSIFTLVCLPFCVKWQRRTQMYSLMSYLQWNLPTCVSGVYKLKLKQSHYTPWRRLWGEEVQLIFILDLGTRWGWVVSVTPLPRFTPGERTPGTHCTGGWVGPRTGLDTEGREQILCLCRGSNPDRPVVQPVVRHYTDWATPAYGVYKSVVNQDNLS
jgi:hypothetical protein